MVVRGYERFKKKKNKKKNGDNEKKG